MTARGRNLTSAAHHEAGHAVAALALGLRVLKVLARAKGESDCLTLALAAYGSRHPYQ
jgi:hypothetical protein